MSRLAALLGTPTPSLGIEISATRVAAVRVAPDGDPGARHRARRRGVAARRGRARPERRATSSIATP